MTYVLETQYRIYDIEGDYLEISDDPDGLEMCRIASIFQGDTVSEIQLNQEQTELLVKALQKWLKQKS